MARIGQLHGHYNNEGCISDYDTESKTILGMMGNATNKVRECVNVINQIDEENTKKNEEVKANLNYLLGDGLNKEVNKTVAELRESGAFEEIITTGIFPEFERRLNSIECDLLKYESFKIGDDWTPALQEAYKHGNNIKIPSGVYYMSEHLVPNNIRIYGEKGTILIPLSLTKRIFRCIGSVGTSYQLTEDKEDFSNIIKINNVNTESGFWINKGDWILLKSQRDCLNITDCGEDWCLGFGTPSTTGVYFGEFQEVKEVTGDTITTIENAIYPYYYKDNTRETSQFARTGSTVQKVTWSQNIKFENLNILGQTNLAFDIQYGKNIKLENIDQIIEEYEDGMTAMFNFYLSYGCVAEKCTLKMACDYEATAHHLVNVMKIQSGQNCTIRKCKTDNCTQGYDITTANTGIPSTNNTIEYCTGVNAHQTGATSHQGSFMGSFVNCIFSNCFQGIFSRTKNSIIQGNIITNQLLNNSYSYGIGLGEGFATNSIIEGNTITNAFTSIIISDGTNQENRWRYSGCQIKNNTCNNFVYGVCVKKNETHDTTPMYIKITGNTLYSTRRVANNNTRGIHLDQGINEVEIKDNTISLINQGSPLTYGIYIGKDGDNISIKDNKFRNCSQAVIHQRLGNKTQLNVEYSGNKIDNVATEHNMIFSGIKLVTNEILPYVQLQQLTDFEKCPRKNCVVITSNKMYFYDRDMNRYEVAVANTTAPLSE